MRHPILDLWPYLLRPLSLIVLMIAPVLILGPPFMIPVAGVTLAIFSWQEWWRWRLVNHVRQLLTANGDRITIHYAPSLQSNWNVKELLLPLRSELDRLANVFGTPFGGRVVIYFVARRSDICRIFGGYPGGVALPAANAIVVADDPNLEEMTRHEFTHLLSNRWSRFAPPLLSEGLSVWLQEAIPGQHLDIVVHKWLHKSEFRLAQFLTDKCFFSEHHRDAAYFLAGSFTGFLIRKHGWERYGRLYRSCNGRRFVDKFETCYGMSLDEAERLWRNEMAVKES